MSEATVDKRTLPKVRSTISAKAYRVEVKSALLAFQKTREWADLIQNLSRLHKVLLKFSALHREKKANFNGKHIRVLPLTVDVCKVLGMCLTPGHPAGVHIKAVEVYQAVFQNLSRQEMIADLGLWLSGLLPLASFASTRVRPILLKLLSTHIIALGEPCRVALDGLIASLLPCIEEQNTDLYSQAMELLNELSENTGLSFFLVSLQRNICSCSNIRIPATHYLNTIFDNQSSKQSAMQLFTTHEYLCIQAILAAVRDRSNVLANRYILDLLTKHFPLNESIHSRLNQSQTINLIHGLLPVILYRDVSVNRRVFQWLLNIAPFITLEAFVAADSPNNEYEAKGMDSDSDDSSDDILNATNQSPVLKGSTDSNAENVLSQTVLGLLVSTFQLYFGANQSQPSTETPLSANQHMALPKLGLYVFKALFAENGSAANEDNRHGRKSRNAQSEGSVSATNVTAHSSSLELVTAPLYLLKILIDREEIRASKLVELLHCDILKYAFSFEPRSEDPTPEEVSCFQSIIQATQLIYAQHDTHDTVQWLRAMFRCSYEDYLQSMRLSDNDQSSPKGLPKLELISNRNMSDSSLVSTVELIDFALDFIPIVDYRQNGGTSNFSEESEQQKQFRRHIYSSVEHDMATLVGDVLASLHTLGISQTRVQSIRFCLKLYTRLGKGCKQIPQKDVDAYLNNSILSLRTVENQESSAKHTQSEINMECEVCEMNFQLLNTVVQKLPKSAIDSSEIQKILGLHLSFSVSAVRSAVSEICLLGVQMWLRLIKDFSFLGRHTNSCSVLALRMWDLIEPAKSSSPNYQITRFIIELANIDYRAVEKVISTSIVNGANASKSLEEMAAGYERFCTLYRIIGELDPLKFYWTEIVYIMLAACDDERPLIRNVGTTWLSESLAMPTRVLDPMLLELLDVSNQTTSVGPELFEYQSCYDAAIAADTLKKLLSIVMGLGSKLTHACSRSKLTMVIIEKLAMHGAILEETAALNSRHGSAMDINEEKSQPMVLQINTHSYVTASRNSSLFLSNVKCSNYLDALVLIGLKYIRGTVSHHSSPETQEANLRVRTTAIEFLRRLFRQIPNNLRSAKLASSVCEAIINQLSVATQRKEYLIQSELLQLSHVLMGVVYRRIDPHSVPRDKLIPTRANGDQSTSELTEERDPSHFLFIDEPSVFEGTFFINTILNGITQSCKLDLKDMQMQLHPLKHFLDYSVFAASRMKVGLAQFTVGLLTVISQELASSHNVQHTKYLLDGLTNLLKRITIDPAAGPLLQDDDEFGDFGSWVVWIATFGQVGARRRNAMSATALAEKSTPVWVRQTESKMFRLFPMILDSMFVAWGRTCNQGFHSMGKNGGPLQKDEAEKRQAASRFGMGASTVYSGSIPESSLRKYRRELVQSHVATVQDKIIEMILPFASRHSNMIFASLLHAWERELNTGKMWALEVLGRRVSGEDEHELHSSEEPDIAENVMNYGGHQVLRTQCAKHNHIIHLLGRIADDVKPSQVIQNVCEIAIATLTKTELKGTGLPVRIHQVTALHFIYYYMANCHDLTESSDIWQSLRHFIDTTLSAQSHPMAYMWWLSILEQMISKFGSSLMRHKKQRNSVFSAVKLISVKISEVAGFPDRFFVDMTDPTALPPILFYVPHRFAHDEDLPPLSQWIRQVASFSGNMLRLSITGGVASSSPVFSMERRMSRLGSDNEILPTNSALAATTSRLNMSNTPQIFSSPTLDVSLTAIRALANACASILHNVYLKNWSDYAEGNTKVREYDSDAVNSILYSIIANLTHLTELKTVEKLPISNAFATFLSSLSIQEFRHTVVSYRKDVWSHFLSDTFFVTDVSSLQHRQWVIRRIIAEDKHKLKSELIANPPSFNVFAKHSTEVNNRANQLKRLAFVIHSGRRDQFGRYLTQILEKLVEAFKVVRADALHRQVFVLLRVLLTRIDVSNLSPVWPLIITEIVRCFEKSKNKDLLLAVCKFVDTALILLPEYFQLFKWSFVVQDAQISVDKDNFIPQLQLLANRLQTESGPKENGNAEIKRSESQSLQSDMQSDGALSAPLSAALVDDLTQTRGYGNGISPNQLRRPILLMRKISSLSELIPFHRIVSNVNQRQTTTDTNAVDIEFLDDLIRSDFIDSEDFPNPLLQNEREPSPFPLDA